MRFITLRGYWCDTVLNLQTPTGDKSDDTKVSFYEELSTYLIKSKVSHKNFLRRFQFKSRDN
jgi:hypothetical protein